MPAWACAEAGSIRRAEEIEVLLFSICSVFTSSVFFSLIITLDCWLLLLVVVC